MSANIITEREGEISFESKKSARQVAIFLCLGRLLIITASAKISVLDRAYHEKPATCAERLGFASPLILLGVRLTVVSELLGRPAGDRIDHIFITAGSVALDARLAPDSASLRPAMDTRFWGAFNAAKYGAAKMNTGGSITFMSGTGAANHGRAVECP